jgi:hypothetical protein
MQSERSSILRNVARKVDRPEFSGPTGNLRASGVSALHLGTLFHRDGTLQRLGVSDKAWLRDHENILQLILGITDPPAKL